MNFVASTLTKGACAKRAKRREISVLPTPVGPIIRIFLGVISPRSGSSTCIRRQRLRIANATARLARFWPTIYLSSSATIFFGVSDSQSSIGGELFDYEVGVGVDAQIGGDGERARDDFARRQRRVFHKRARRRRRVAAAAADGGDIVLRLQHIAQAGKHELARFVGEHEHRFEPAQNAVGAPIARERFGGAQQIALVDFEFFLEQFQQRESVGGGAGESGQDLAVDEGGGFCGRCL